MNDPTVASDRSDKGSEINAGTTVPDDAQYARCHLLFRVFLATTPPPLSTLVILYGMMAPAVFRRSLHAIDTTKNLAPIHKMFMQIISGRQRPHLPSCLPFFLRATRFPPRVWFWQGRV